MAIAGSQQARLCYYSRCVDRSWQPYILARGLVPEAIASKERGVFPLFRSWLVLFEDGMRLPRTCAGVGALLQWNLEISDRSFNIVDIKPSNMEDLTEVITSAEFHPNHCSLLAYSSSKGNIRLVDMRQSALCDSPAKLFDEQEPPSSRNFFR